MPLMDGFTATKHVRKREASQHIQPATIVACTGALSKNEIEKCSRVGFDSILAKPVKKDVLKTLLAKVFGSG